MDIFEKACRNKLRFESQIGLLNAEQLWDLPLTAKGERPDLDKLARAVHLELKGLDEVSFVNLTPDPRKSEMELQLDILKYIISAKLSAKAEAEKAADNAERKRRLLAALASKEDADLAGMSKEQIEAEIAKLT